MSLLSFKTLDISQGSVATHLTCVVGGLRCVVGIMINSSNVVELMVASDKLGMTSVMTQCCDVIDRCPLDRVLQIISDASDIGLNDLAILDSKVSRNIISLASCTPRIYNFILLLIEWVHSFSTMLPSVKFAEDKVLVFFIFILYIQFYT